TLRPEAVAAFGSIRAHLATVEACAPRGIHVMVEKPLSFKKADAQRMVSLANKHKILLLTNYETSWYPTVQKTYQLVHDDKAIGKITKVLVNDGHSGLKNSETNKYFFNWLTDPVENGGGA